MKMFLTALDKKGKCFEYLCNTFPDFSIEKTKQKFVMNQELENV